MAKNLERAKEFQRTLWEAGGREWTESNFTDNWILTPYGADWDEWQSQGLMPIHFCPMCGDDDLNGGKTITKKFSVQRVQIPFCAECAAANDNWFPKEAPLSRQIANLGCLIMFLVVVAGIGWAIYRILQLVF